MDYISTRTTPASGQSPVSFEAALLAGLAPDGGLYMPVSWPRFSPEDMGAMVGHPFWQVAQSVLAPFCGDTFSAETLAEICKSAFASFDHPATTPLVQVGDEDWVLELFHGPTLAFKDVAMQVLGGMFETVLTRTNQRLTIVGATSGDTGGAAIEALKDREGIEVFILHPEGRISQVQRRIMTTCPADNIHNIAIEGTFDDCQAIVKTMFGDQAFVQKVSLGGVNSINWARIMVQAVYYFTAAMALGGPGRAVSFVVPTGNFGDIFAGYVASKMGLPINRLGVATNQNNIVHRVLASGDYFPGTVTPTASPSMDIQVASNFERLIFEQAGRDAGYVRDVMGSLKEKGGFTLRKDLVAAIGECIVSADADAAETNASMASHQNTMGYSIDPHTAVGCVVATKLRAEGKMNGPIVTLATAHPAKFPEAVAAATGVHPALPAGLTDLFDRAETIHRCENNVASVKEFISRRVAA
ncbi:MAG: threonine synthase [Pseudomonadota bacterium]